MSDAARVLDCFAALRRAFGGDIATGAGESITTAQLHALQALDHKNHTAGQLARAISISLPSLTQLIDGLVERGAVVRTADADDRRKVWLSITPSGRSLFAQAHALAEARVADVLADLSPTQVHHLVEGLEALHGAMHARWLAGQARPEAHPAPHP